jgi:putative intracellular protease/amidase
LHEAGFKIDFVSPKGGTPPVTHLDLEDPINKKFWENETYRNKIDNTLKPAAVNPEDYIAIYFAGGHGAMWDLPDESTIAAITRTIYENGGIVAAVCHGPAGLVNVKLNNGKYLVEGRMINSFTNQEEIAIKLDGIVPFLLETRLVEHGAIFEKSDPRQEHVAVDQRIVTGQNPKSARGVGEAILAEINRIPQSRTA